MSFLSRKPARPDGRGRGDEYDDYDGYAQDGYQNEDAWSPGEYFSPEGIKGKWAGENPDGRSGGRGRRDDGASNGYDSYGNDFSDPDYGGGSGGASSNAGYASDDFATAMYDLPEGADEDRPDRSRRRRSRDREDRGERTGILRLRRDRGEDIWPDDGISDEDYWASVAADRPLTGTDSPADNVPAANGAGPRPGADPRPGGDSPFGSDQRGGERGATGRLGPPPGLAADYKSSGTGPLGGSAPAGGTGPMGRSGQANGGGRPGSGPMPARGGTTGSRAARPGTGPTPTVGVTASRPPAGQNGTRPGPAHPGPANSFPQPALRPSFQPNSRQSGSLPGTAPAPAPAPAGGRPQDRGDWGDRTERIERVNAAGYPEPRPGGRSQGLSSPGAAPRSSGPLGPGTSSSPGLPGTQGAPGRGRGDNSARRGSDRPAPERREPDRREPSRDSGRDAGGPWPAPVPARGGAPARTGTDDDPLTSKAYSRAALSETDGRSYRVAARRSQAQVKLTEQTAETFINAQYQQGRGNEQWQYRGEMPASSQQAPAHQAPAHQAPSAGRYQAPGGQAGSGAQAGRGQAGPAQPAGHGGQPGRGSSRPGLPGAGAGRPGGQYEAQPSRPPQQQRQQPQQRQPQLPAAGLPAGQPASDPGSARPTGTGGLNPYDSVVPGSYPYQNQNQNQNYPTRPAPTGAAQDGTDDRYQRPPAPDGYGSAGPGQGGGDRGRNGYGNGYPPSGGRR